MPAEVIAQTGPGATAPVTPKPAAPAVPPAAAAPAPSAPPPKPPDEKVADERRVREVMLARQKAQLEGAAKKEREGFGQKLTRLGELEKERAQAKLNPEAFLKSVYGDGWHEHLMAVKLNGGVPTADVLADEIARVEERVEAKWKARDEEARKAAESQRVQSVEGARRQLHSEATQFWKTAANDFPVLEGLGDAGRVSALLAERIESHYNSTVERNEAGQLLRDGQVLSMKEAAAALEDQILGLAEKAVAAPKYAERFKPKVVAPVAPAVRPHAEQPRRTLSNDLTGSTPARSAPANDSERRARAIAAYEATRKPA